MLADGGLSWLFVLLWVAAYVAVLALAIWVVVRIARLAWYSGDRRPPQPPQPPADSALQILRERYARGEIDEAEFEERARRLRGY